MSKKICVVTATRAEYGLLRNIIFRIDADEDLELCLVVTGTHLSQQYGYTIQEIQDDNVTITEQVPILSDLCDEYGIVMTIANAASQFAKVFQKHKPDMLILLGDRYELVPICQAAVIFGVPITHISGGEITEGAVDDMFRNAITSMSQLHFPGCEIYRERIIRMGIDSHNVFNYGDVGVENIRKMRYFTREQIVESLGLRAELPIASVTFHPATKEKGTAEKQIQELLHALEQFPDIQFVITKANADAEGQCINEAIDKFVCNSMHCKAYFSLGARKYLSLLKYSDMIIGNSSSGIVEAPCFHIPTINIGNRQKGRLQADSIINCDVRTENIVSAIKKACTVEFRNQARIAVNPYGDGETSELIVDEIKKYLKGMYK